MNISKLSSIGGKLHWSIPLFIIAVLTTITTFVSLSQTVYANGWDSYFYLIQIKSWVEEGAMHSSDLSFIYPLMLVCFKIVGSYLLSFKLTASLLAGAVCGLSGVTVYRWSSKKSLALIVAALLCFSPHLSYVAAQYPKNLLGVCFFLLLCIFGDVKRRYILLPLLLLNFFGHRMTAVLAFLYSIALFVQEFKYAKQLLIVGISFLLLFIASIYIPGILSPLDFERFQGILSPTFQFPFTAFLNSFGSHNIDALWKGELFLYTVGFMLLLLVLPFIKKTEQHKKRTAFMLTMLILILPIYKWTIDGAALRFYLIFILLAPLALVYIDTLGKPKFQRWVAAVVVPLLCTIQFTTKAGYTPQKHDPSYTTYDLMTQRVLQKVPAEEIELIIGHKSLAEYFTFTTGIDVLPWEVEYEVAPEKLWRIATDIELQTLYYYSNEEDHDRIYRLGVNYFFMPDYVWKSVLKKAAQDEDLELLERVKSWRNPHVVRPAYLLKNKK